MATDRSKRLCLTAFEVFSCMVDLPICDPCTRCKAWHHRIFCGHKERFRGCLRFERFQSPVTLFLLFCVPMPFLQWPHTAFVQPRSLVEPVPIHPIGSGRVLAGNGFAALP